jgi:nicotinamidase/pyrazinamidase
MEGEVSMNRKVLLVIDMLNDFLDPKGALFCGKEVQRIIPVVRALVDEFSLQGHLVIYARDAHAPNDKEFELFPSHAVKGSWGSQIISELTPPDGAIVIDKTRFTAFFGSTLDEVFADYRPDEVWVAGVCTSICVMDTTGDLRNRDYTVVIPVDAVADFDPEFHSFALKRMERIYGAKLVRYSDRRAA